LRRGLLKPRPFKAVNFINILFILFFTVEAMSSHMTKSRKFFAVHPGEILKIEFMKPMGVSAYQLAKALDFPGIYDVVRGDRAISADTAIRLGKYFGLPAQFWLNLQNDYDLRIAQASGIGRGIKPRNAARDAELTGTR
jgi:antitoxin HigA-1